MRPPTAMDWPVVFEAVGLDAVVPTVAPNTSDIAFFCSSPDQQETTVLFCIGSTGISPYHWLAAGYVFGLLLFIAYFVFEHSWIHRTRRIENVYIIVALTLVQFFCFIEFHWRGLRSDSTSKSFARDCFRHTSSIILFAYLVQVHVSYSRLARFGGSGRRKHHAFARSENKQGMAAMISKSSAGSTKKTACGDSESMPHSRAPVSEPRRRGTLGGHMAPDHTTYHSIRISEEIDNLIEDVLASFRKSDIWTILTAYLVETLWFIGLVANFGWVFIDVSRGFQYILLVLEVVLFVYTWWVGLKRLCLRYLPPVKALHNVIEQLVGYADEMILEKVLINLSVPDLVEAISFNTLALLTKVALEQGSLTMLSKCVILDALQKRGLKQRIFAAEAASILLSCRGRELTLVKNSIDEGGDYHNLYKFMYIDIKDKQLRRQILDHFRVEALAQRRQLEKGVGVKILSDIDDTLYSSGGHWPAGCDQRYPRNVIYPGFLTLVRILDRTWSSSEPSCNLVFLSARPHIYKSYSENVSYGKFKQLVEDGRMHTMPTLLPGELTSGLFAITRYLCNGNSAWKKVGKKKLEMYRNFRDLYLEYDFVFFGDNGQGDLWAGEMMDLEQRNALVSPRDGPQLMGVCIHQVIPEECSLRCTDKPTKNNSRMMEPRTSSDFVDGSRMDLTFSSEDWGCVSVHRTYVGAAVRLHMRDSALVRARDLIKVCQDAIEEFDKMRLVYAEWGASWETAEKELRADLEEARKALGLGMDDDEEFPELETTAEVLKRSHLEHVFRPVASITRSNSLFSSVSTTVSPVQNADGTHSTNVRFAGVPITIPHLGRSRSRAASKRAFDRDDARRSLAGVVAAESTCGESCGMWQQTTIEMSADASSRSDSYNAFATFT